MNSSTDHARAALVATLKATGDVTSSAVLDAIQAVPRHLFVPSEEAAQAYEDIPLAIGCGQTIYQPYVVATMTQALGLQPTSRVLEVGTGSGYQAMVLSRLCQSVITLECVGTLALEARARFRMLHANNILSLVADGTLGYPPLAPYDAIIITAAAEHVPPPLVEQLKLGGRLVAPLGGTQAQRLCLFEKHADGSLTEKVLFNCRFVPLLGAYGRNPH